MSTYTCSAATQPSGDRCGKPATHEIHWPERDSTRVDKTLVCYPCALVLAQIAESHGTRLKIEKLTVEMPS